MDRSSWLDQPEAIGMPLAKLLLDQMAGEISELLVKYDLDWSFVSQIQSLCELDLANGL